MVVTKAHCYYCFDVLVAHFEGRRPCEPEFQNEQYPLFVTWNTIQEDGSHRLRGCIGNFDALPLHSGLKEYALTSSLRDRRFSPVKERELPNLSCGVSLLTEFEDGKDYLDWEIGTHGIWIEFRTDSGSRRSATYLPEVAAEQGWTKLEAIDSLLRKGGHTGKITDKLRKSIQLTRYQSSKTAVTYSDYVQWKGSKPHRVDTGYSEQYAN
ncbi:uncharacterized protein SPPG_06096 [Spizellomyces punctatus DAOM BR117]|uniref:AMMECR1 domain-containing protein n=1 Tax=Spizellomyces punctatus (strain DAOM BR117) TaxID=645134 RepID=A0A0L0HA04_SPIPD|nr:uncharacterized protein SPPG_06096 [Spizellomyces punctatus DAOM BR117]KNC98390.1 hypothetical protein SPPG_06096 [Spizellomyces punctatus DAOM BR117]|eukprot:XP_016606430.1 hypothetical protein SPPG_06096 [Spizellomyces punctatus DAOM BR117]